MSDSARITAPEYYKAFGSFRGAVAALFGLLPASSLVIPGRIFPPLGNDTLLAQSFAVVVAIVVTYLVFIRQNIAVSKIKRTITFLILVSIVFFFGYLAAREYFVCEIYIPSIERANIVSVGYQRTDFANSVFGTATNLEMLRARGSDDEEIFRLWTKKSVYVSRSVLFLSYLGCALCLVAFASLSVLLHLRDSHGVQATTGSASSLGESG